eukprot:scaffold25_cov342-Pavlova_lutheri.AAC.48
MKNGSSSSVPWQCALWSKICLYLYTSARMLRSCRLYSWMRFAWTSNIARVFTRIPHFLWMYEARRSLFAIFASCHAAWKTGSMARTLSLLRFAKVFNQDLPPNSRSSSRVREGLATRIHRLGLTPFVTLTNLCGCK